MSVTDSDFLTRLESLSLFVTAQKDLHDTQILPQPQTTTGNHDTDWEEQLLTTVKVYNEEELIRILTPRTPLLLWQRTVEPQTSQGPLGGY